MGEVHLAHDLALDRKAALKFLPAGQAVDESARKRLTREAHSAARLDHPFICATGLSSPISRTLTGDAVFDRSLRAAFEVGIAQSQFVNVFPPGRVQATLRRMQKPAVDRLDEPLASEIAAREGVRAVFAGSIAQVGEVYSLTARVNDELIASRPINNEGQQHWLRAHVRLGELYERLGRPDAARKSLRAAGRDVEGRRPGPRGTHGSSRAPGQAARELISRERNQRDQSLSVTRVLTWPPSVRWAVALIVLSAALAATPINWPLADFAEYWAAGRLMNAGGNPYDPGAMLREQTEIGLKQPQPIMMYNPPWTLVLAMPPATLKFWLARSIWLPLQILIMLWCASRLWVLYGGAPRHATRACYLALLWMPTIIALHLGQVSPVVLLGLVGFLWSLDNRRDVAAGACLSLTAVKPQIVALVWVALVPWVIANRRWKVLAGAAACIAGASLAVAWVNPNVFVQYRHLMATAPPTLEFESPNLATVLRVMIGTDRSWPQFIPTCAGIVGVALLWHRRRRTWEWSRELPALVLVSCLLTAYGGWAFDLVVLLIPIIATAATLVRSGRRSLVVCGASAFLAVSLVAFAMHQARVPQGGFVWMTPAVLLFAAGLVRAAGGAAAQKQRVGSHPI